MDKFNNHSNESRDVVELSWIVQELEAFKQKIKSDLDQLHKDVSRSSRSKKQKNLSNKKEWIVQERELVTKESKSEGSALKNTISSQSRKKKKSKTI